MKYLVRVIKYFVYLTVILTLFIAVLIAFKMVGTSVDEIFRDGAKSIWQIAGIIAVFAAVYPAMGFTRRGAIVPGSYAEVRNDLVKVMNDRGYVLESEKADVPGQERLTFRKRSPLLRLTRMLEDRITMDKEVAGFTLEGPSKDLARLIGALEFKFRTPEA
ncbi:MAG: hypothetical protein IJ686_04165 [Bacteroidales bacterium]|nr:hypothetical protein [Bacteroidales bacterium]